MNFLYYFQECPTCKNEDRNLVKSCALQAGVFIDERYIYALPDVWGEEVNILSARGAKVPFLYNPEDETFLNVDHEEEGAKANIKQFFEDGLTKEE